MTTAVCPGSFDPITYGHLDVIERTARLVDTVIVAIGQNSTKTALFSVAERVEMVTQACAGVGNVRVSAFTGLLVDFCAAAGASVISKGVRSASDLDFELPMAHMNRKLTGVDTLLLPASPQWSYVSSSLVREVARLGGNVAGFLPEPVAARMLARIAEAGPGTR